MNSIRAGFERVVGDGACLGAGAALLTLLSYEVAIRWYPPAASLPEQLLVVVMGTGPSMIFEPFDLLILRGGYICLPIILIALVWRRSRSIVLAVLGLLLMFETARLTAFATFSVYVMHHGLGFLVAPLAVLPAVCLTRWQRLPILSIVLLTGGLCVGVLVATFFQHDFPDVVSPVHRFIPATIVAVVIAWLVSIPLRDMRSVTLRRFAHIWGLATICVACIIFVAIATQWLRPRVAPPSRFLSQSAYDVRVTGEPPVLVWTDTEEIHVLTEPYGQTHHSYMLSGGHHRTPQRLWPSATDGFYVQMLGGDEQIRRVEQQAT